MQDLMQDDPERVLRSVLRYIGAEYGGSLAHHLVALALKNLLRERYIPEYARRLQQITQSPPLH